MLSLESVPCIITPPLSKKNKEPTPQGTGISKYLPMLFHPPANFIYTK